MPNPKTRKRAEAESRFGPVSPQWTPPMSRKQGPTDLNREQVSDPETNPGLTRYRTKFTGYGREVIQKEVKQSGNSGRVYLPPEWVGKSVKVIRID